MRSPRIAVAMATFLLLAATGVVVAQDELPAASEPPAAVGSALASESPADMSTAAAELVALFPETIGGQPTNENMLVRVGTDLVAGLDPADPDDASDIAEFEALASAFGAPIEELGSASTYVQTEDGGFALFGVFRAPGKDASLGIDAVLASAATDLEQPRPESTTYAGREITLLYDDGQPEAQPWYIYATGDTLWLVIASEPLLAEVFEHLP